MIHSKAWAEFSRENDAKHGRWTEILDAGEERGPGPTRRIPLNKQHALHDFGLLIRDAEELENEV